LTLAALVPSYFVHHKWARIFSLVVNTIGAILSSAVFGIDLAIVSAARSGVKQYLTDMSISFGPEIWMSLAAVIFLWIAVASHSVVSCYCCGRVRGNDKKCRPLSEHVSDDVETSNTNIRNDGVRMIFILFTASWTTLFAFAAVIFVFSGALSFFAGIASNILWLLITIVLWV
jgi:hypothetical protein